MDMMFLRYDSTQAYRRTDIHFTLITRSRDEAEITH